MVLSANQPRNQDVHILVADDEEMIREMLCDVLLCEKYSVTPYDPVTSDPLILQIPCDAVITDIFMPTTDGFKLCEKIRKFSPDAQFIIITGNPDQKLLERAMDIGAYTFLTKPFNAEQIKYSIRGALRMRETMQQLFMATQKLEKNNKALEKTIQMEHRLNERFRANIEYFSNIAVKTTGGVSHRE